MASTATHAEPRLLALALPGIPESVPVARSHVRAALGSHGLGEYADDAEIITSELVTNAVQHACGNGTKTIEVTLTAAGSAACGDRRCIGLLPARPHQTRHAAR